MANAGGMFDISGPMWLVYILFADGMKNVFIPWIWPLVNQLFLMISPGLAWNHVLARI
jgi:SSS family solute:Na+ symporter